MANSPKKPGDEPDPDTTSPFRDMPGHDDDAERVEEDGEPLDGNST
jgi:hypothetical protein